MRVRVGCDVTLESSAPTPTVALVRPREQDGAQRLIDERLTSTPGTTIAPFADSYGNTLWRWTSPAGSFRLRYDALVEVPRAADPDLSGLPGTLVDALPSEVLQFTLPSRHCQSDLALSDAWELFSAAEDGAARVQAICDWAHANIEYGYGNSNARTSGWEAYQQRRGVCRDFAHIGIMFCRAMNIPARYVCGYLPDIDVPYNPIPMDFHAWFEAYIDGAWRTYDARHNVPRIGRVVVARGRDAIDGAFLTCYGPSVLAGFTVWADEVGDDVTLDVPLVQGEVQG